MRNEFKKLLNSVQKQCPELITEEVYNDMMTQFDDGLAKVTADATAEGQALGFKEGYEEGKRVAQEQSQAELTALTEKMDTEAVEKLTSILEMIDEKDTAKLQELYDFVKENFVSRQEMTDALVKQDQEYADKFQTAIDQINDDHAEKFEYATECICEDHAKKMQKAVDCICEDHAKKLNIVKESIDKKYKNLLTESINSIDKQNTAKLQEVADVLHKSKDLAVESVKKEYQQKLDKAAAELNAEKERKTDILAEGVEKYLNYALEQFMPKKQLISEAKYNSAIKTLDKVTDLLKVHKIIQESKEGIFTDYEQKLAEAKEQQNKLITEKIELRAQLNKKEAQLVLEEKLQKYTPSEARFLKTYFKDATSPKVIEESIEGAHAAWKKLQSERRQALQESVDKKVNKVPSKVVTESQEPVKREPVKKVISEQKSVANNSDQQLVDYYAKILNK